jgi:hypothetical protein
MQRESWKLARHGGIRERIALNLAWSKPGLSSLGAGDWLCILPVNKAGVEVMGALGWSPAYRNIGGGAGLL